MNPDFTLIWPLICPKDGDHFLDGVYGWRLWLTEENSGHVDE